VVAASARLILAAVLAAAGVAKLADRRRVVRLVGAVLTPRVAAPVAAVVPAVELGLAALLLVWWASALPALLSMVVLGAFTVVLVRAQLRGVPCPCFGGMSGEQPAGPRDVLRNGVLLALAVLATAT